MVYDIFFSGTKLSIPICRSNDHKMYPPSIFCTLKLTTMVNHSGPTSKQLRSQVLSLYKTVRIWIRNYFYFVLIVFFHLFTLQLLYYGRDYPLGYKYFRDRCHRAFIKNRDESDPQQIIKQISRGEFIIKELEALYRLRKYRYLKQRYYPDKQDLDDGELSKINASIDPKLMLKKFEATQQQSSTQSQPKQEKIKQ